MTCSRDNCDQAAWAHTPFCIPHLIRHLRAAYDRDSHPPLRDVLGDLMLQGISRAQRLALILRYWEGMTLKEIGMTLDLSESSVRRLERQAIEHLYKNEPGPGFEVFPLRLPTPADVQVLSTVHRELALRASKNPELLHQLSPRQFEELIAEILSSQGLSVELTAQSRDGGFDIVAFSRDPMDITSKYLVECKHYRDKPVGVAMTRALYGLKDAERAQHVILATTSRFTKGAIELARKPTVVGLHLRDRGHLLKWLRDYRQLYSP